MYIIGMILLVVGAILFFGARIVSRNNEKSINHNSKGSEDNDFLILVNNAMLAVRTIGAVMVISGGIIIIFIK
ncbi:MAG: hypothetical protein CVV02_01390 [Firmicutes bacterium HGW-Firmicutes-7]|nr:MAG: hypothetical protein CVV02_01390 [Firmicutes bacterium HGW-Firmicutes-7]